VPLWDVEQRVFFPHDGRTGNLLTTIKEHYLRKIERFPESEANAVIMNYFRLPAQDQQATLDFLRSLQVRRKSL
jgi:hypothetical protein